MMWVRAICLACVLAVGIAQDSEQDKVHAELVENTPIGEENVPPPPPGPPPANTPEDLNEEAEEMASNKPSDESEPADHQPQDDESEEDRFDQMQDMEPHQTGGFPQFPGIFPMHHQPPQLEISFETPTSAPPLHLFPQHMLRTAPRPAFPDILQAALGGSARPPMPEMELEFEGPSSPLPSARRELLGGLFQPIHHPPSPFAAVLGSPLGPSFPHPHPHVPHPFFLPGMGGELQQGGFGLPPVHMHPPVMQFAAPRRGPSALPMLDILDTVLSELPKVVQDRHETIPSDHEPMVLKIEKNKDFYVVTGWLPGVRKADLKLKVEGSTLKVAGAVSDKSEEMQKALGDFADIEEVDETMELPYAPDSRFVKAHFDEGKHTLTVVFPQEKTTSINLS